MPFKYDPRVYIHKNEVSFILLTLYVNDILLLGADRLPLNKLKKQLVVWFDIIDTSDVSRAFDINVARDRENVAIASDRKGNTEDDDERIGMKGCNPVCTLGMGPDLCLNQPDKNS